jgi:hypothetical protein
LLKLTTALKFLGHTQLTEEDVKEMVCAVDDDESFTLELREFLSFMCILDKVVKAKVPE